MAHTSRYSHLGTTMIIMLLMVQWSIPELQARSVGNSEMAPCREDDDLMNLCQRCAKATKSVNAFPMCCSDEDNARNYCRDYIYFGLQTDYKLS